MGFLNHSTNNIIIDAVLTERGRELLSLNNGSFKISKFSCSDDEVDYSLVTKYGKNIGKEKIEKNTPIFEAITNQNLALKYPLRSFGNVFNQFDTLTKIPVLKELNNVTSITLKSDVTNTNLTDKALDIINFIDTTDSNESVNKNLVDKVLYVKVDCNLLKVKNGSVYSKDKDIIVYRVPVNSATNKVFSNQVQGSFTITAKNVVNDTTYTKYSDGSSNTTINTQIQVIGDVSGSSYIIPVKIEKT
tara:strand:+ start:11717 stop:12454 length:738 start_codon:yes stop_codon:yes gene_type:complete